MISLKIMVSDPLSTGQESQLLLKRKDTVMKLQTVMLLTIKKFKITKIQKMTLSLIMVSELQLTGQQNHLLYKTRDIVMK